MEKYGSFKDLTLRKKVEHIWIYYRYYILAAIFAVFVIASLINTFFMTPESLLDVIMLDSNPSADSDPAPFAEFMDTYGYENYEGAVTVNTNLRFYDAAELALLEGTDLSAAEQENYDREQILFTLMAAGNTEILFGQNEFFLNYAHAGMLMDLTTILSPELLSRYEDQLIYTTESDTVEAYPCAIALSGNKWLSENGYYETCYFGIMYLTDNPEIAAQFAEYLLNDPE